MLISLSLSFHKKKVLYMVSYMPNKNAPNVVSHRRNKSQSLPIFHLNLHNWEQSPIMRLSQTPQKIPCHLFSHVWFQSPYLASKDANRSIYYLSVYLSKKNSIFTWKTNRLHPSIHQSIYPSKVQTNFIKFYLIYLKWTVSLIGKSIIHISMHLKISGHLFSKTK